MIQPPPVPGFSPAIISFCVGAKEWRRQRLNTHHFNETQTPHHTHTRIHARTYCVTLKRAPKRARNTKACFWSPVGWVISRRKHHRQPKKATRINDWPCTHAHLDTARHEPKQNVTHQSTSPMNPHHAPRHTERAEDSAEGDNPPTEQNFKAVHLFFLISSFDVTVNI